MGNNWGGGGNSWYTYPAYDYSKQYNWASGFTYVQPDYKKTAEKIKERQNYYNAQGIPLRASYSPTERSLIRKPYGLVITTIKSVSDMDKIVKFCNKASAIGISELGDVDDYIMNMYNKWYSFIPLDRFNTIEDVMASAIDYEAYKELLAVQIKKHLEEKKEKAGRAGTHWGGYGHSKAETVDSLKVEKVKEALLNRLTPPKDINQRDADLRKGKRINRKFVNGLSYKPLMRETTLRVKKKKVLSIVDGSGSMWNHTKTKEVMFYEASQFMWGLIKTGLFECDGFFSTSSTLSKAVDDTIWSTGGGEGFDCLEHRLNDMGYHVKDYDYVFIYTDCLIGNDEMSGLQTLMSNNRHILFSFNPQQTESYKELFPELNFVDVECTANMTDALVSYI